MEEWRDIKGYEGLYQVSNMGRIKGLSRHKKGKENSIYLTKEKILKLNNVRGYLQIQLFGKQNNKWFKIHRLVAEAFIPNLMNLPQINHKNGIKTDNCINNLEWVSQSQNVIHAYKNGLIVSSKGEKCGASKLTEKEILEIRNKYIPRKYTQEKLSKEYNTTSSNISFIINKKQWKHI